MKSFLYKHFKTIFIAFTTIFALCSCDAVEDLFESPDKTPKPDINRGLVLYYNFDEGSAKDLTTNGFNGILQNSPEFITETPNQKGQAVFLNGFKENLINIPYNPLADSTNYSVSLWLKDFTSGEIIKSFDANGRNTELSLTALMERIFQFKVGRYDNYIYSFSNYNFSDIQQGNWHLITICLDTTIEELKLYVDGILVDKVGGVRAYEPRLIKLQIGSDSDTPNSFKIDNFRIYNRCITAEEVKIIYDTERQ